MTTEIDRWLLAHGFVPEDDSFDLFSLAWSQRHGFDFMTLCFYRADDCWLVSARNHASGENPCVNIGVATSVAEIERLYEALRLINGYQTPEDHRAPSASERSN